MLYKKIVRPLLFQLEPEFVHESVIHLASLCQRLPGLISFLKLLNQVEAKGQSKILWGKKFRHPIGLAAGFDKNAQIISFLHALGFSFIEVGSVTHLPSSGNLKPRVFRFPNEETLVNRMGLNNDGAHVISQRLQSKKASLPVGISIAKTHSPKILGEEGIIDVCKSYSLLRDKGDYLCLNISCPNTEEGKTFEDKEQLDQLLRALKGLRENEPLLLKLSPDLSLRDLDSILTLAQDYSLSGVVLGNTTKKRSPSMTFFEQAGGLSGPVLFSSVLEKCTYIKKNMPSDFVLIACGGINTEERARLLFDAGADLLQIYTGLIYEGPSIIKNLKNACL